MLQAVIFDFDGVITDTEILHLRSFNHVLAEHNIRITVKDYYKNYLGLTDFDIFNLFINNGKIKNKKGQVENLIEQKKQIFEKLAKTEGNIIEGVRDFLKILRKNTISIAICSGSLLSEIELILEQAKLRPFFEVIVSAEQVEQGKPNPEGFILTLKKLNENTDNQITPDQCIVIEDSHWGLEAAKAAGMHTVAITNSYDAAQLTMADKVVEHLDQLKLKDLQKLCS